MCVRMLIVAMFFTVMGFNGLSQVRETTVTLGKDKIHAVKMDLDAPAKEVQEALHKRIGASSSPKKAASGSFYHNNVVLQGVMEDSVDVWTRVQKNGPGSTIYLGVRDASGNFINGEADSSKVDQLKKFLYEFARSQNYESKDLKIGALMDSVQMDQNGMQERSAQKTRIQNQIRELNSQLQALEQQEKADREAMEQRRTRLEQMRRPANDSTPTKSNRSGQ